MLPFVAITDALLVVSKPPSVTFVAPTTRRLPALVIRLVSLINTAAADSTSIVPPVLRRSPPAFSSTPVAPSTVRFPLAVTTSALVSTTTDPAIACSNTLPVPFAFNDWPAPVADPTDRVRLPVLVRSTIDPFPPSVRTSDWVASVMVEFVTVPSASTRFTVTVTSSITRSLASSTQIPPSAARALSVPTIVSRWLAPAPIAVPATIRRPADVMS